LVYATTTTESTLHIPLQAAPVDRTPSGVAAYGEAAGIEAAGWFDDIVDVGGKILSSPLGQKGLSYLGSLI
jgi:hypothetical protein